MQLIFNNQMIDCLCFGRRRKYEEFNQTKCLSSEAATVSNTEAGKQGSQSDHEYKESSTVSKNETQSNNRARVFNYRELATATKNFHPNNFLGEGGFGSVYKGKLLGTDEVVAVKKLNLTGVQGEKEFLVEVLMFSLLRHSNLVNMIGYCAEGIQRLLVLEYMPLGSLEAHLHDLPPDSKPLDWDTRMKIAAGAAKGVDYLHREAKPPVIFRDLKPSNILLDEAFNPKLSDFGLAKFGPVGDRSHVSTRIMGTDGYCAPEYALTGKLTAKSDTFSFGVVLLELISGRKALELTRLGGKTSLVEWALPFLHDRKYQVRLADPQLKGQFPVSGLRKAINVAAMCLREDANLRPTMHEVSLAMDFLTTLKQDHKRSVSAENITTDTIIRKETTNILSINTNREQAVAEAKLWGEKWREKRRQSADADSSWVNQIQKEL